MKKKIIVMVLVVFVALSASGCGRKPPQQPEEVGFVDYAKLYSSHPLAAEARELEFKQNFVENKARNFSVAAIPFGINGKIAEAQMLEIFFRQEMLAKTQEAQYLVDVRKKQEEQLLRNYVENELNKQASADCGKAMGLNTELNVLELDDAKKTQIKAEIDTLFRDDDDQKSLVFAAKKKVAVAAVNEYVAKIRQDVNSFASDLHTNVQNDFSYASAGDMKAFAVSDDPVKQMKNMSVAQMDEMHKRYVEIQKKITADIAQAIAVVAKAKNLKVVIGTPRVNVRFTDVTSEVVERLVHGI